MAPIHAFTHPFLGGVRIVIQPEKEGGFLKEGLRQVSNLVDRFERNIEAYRSPSYNETQLRREFIDPFFEALGWDVANKSGYAEQYKDVVHEDAIKIAGATKAPDYCFRIGGMRKFFLETKKPSIDIKGEVSPAYQLRRYAWSAKLPLSILTDFEEMAVYDCRLRPKPTDKPSVGRVRIYNYSQYLSAFEEIYNILILTNCKPKPEVTVSHQELSDGTPFLIDIFGISFLLNLQPRPCMELNEGLKNAGFKAFPLYD